MKCFEKKVCVVTGGASGIGYALSRQLAQFGAIVIIADIQIELAEKAVQDLADLPGNVVASLLDVTQEEAFQKLLQETQLQYGSLDYLFNNAGTSIIGEFRDLKREHWEKIMAVNLWGVVYGTIEGYQIMIKQGSGHLINIASGYGLLPGSLNIPYVASKHAVVGLTKSLRAEAQGLGVKVSLVCPGFIDTHLTQKFETVNANREMIRSLIPFKFASPEKTAKKILKGVARNRGRIAFPFYVLLLNWFHQFFSGIYYQYEVYQMGKYRKNKETPD